VTSFLSKLFSSWRGSTLQLIAAIVIPLTLTLVAIAFGSFFLHQNAMRAMVGERDERAVRASAAIIQSEIQRRADFVRGLAVFTEQDNILEQTRRQVETNSALFEYGLALYPLEGKAQVISGDAAFWQSISPDMQMSPISTMLVAEKPVVLVSYTDLKTGAHVMGAFSPNTLLKNTLEADFPANGNAAVYIFDSSYRILYRSGAGTLEDGPMRHPGIAEGLAGQSGATYVQVENDEHVIAYSFIPATGWAIVIEESWEAVSTPTLQATQITPLILIPALLLAMLALWFGAEQIVRPLRALETKATKLAWGDFQEIEKPVQGITEIRHLQNELIHLARQVQAAQQSLHNYIGAITRGQEDERQRLARELHDDTIQSLIALKQRVQLSQRALPQDAPVLPALAELETLTEDAIKNLRRTIRALRPIYLEDFGLASALEILAKETAQAASLEIQFQKVGIERRLSPEVELALYRMAQESLNNVARHSQAKKASVYLEFALETIRVEISDDGRGFTPPSSPAEYMPGGHFGLVGLHERAQLLGAKLEIKSTPGKGTQVAVTLQDKQ